jgi:hypothetical protein
MADNPNYLQFQIQNGMISGATLVNIVVSYIDKTKNQTISINKSISKKGNTYFTDKINDILSVITIEKEFFTKLFNKFKKEGNNVYFESNGDDDKLHVMFFPAGEETKLPEIRVYSDEKTIVLGGRRRRKSSKRRASRKSGGRKRRGTRRSRY